MKNLLLFTAFIFATNGVFAQTDSTTGNLSTKDPTKVAADSTKMAKIYVIRSTGHIGSAVNLRVLVDSINFCKVKNNHYAQFYVQPGTHLFNATTWDKPGTNEKFALKVPVEAGKTYYMSAKIKQRFVGIEITLEEITYNTAAPLLEKYKPDECL